MHVSQSCALFAELIYVCMFHRGVLYLKNWFMYACFTDVCFICRTDLCMHVSQRCALFTELIYVCMFHRGVLYLQNTISTCVKFPNKSAAQFNRLSAPSSATLHVTVTSQKTSVWPRSYWLWKVLLYFVNIIIRSWRKCRNRRRYKSLESCTVSTQKKHTQIF